MIKKIFIGFIFIGIAVGIFFGVQNILDSNKISVRNNFVFSNQAVLKELWERYKEDYIESDTYRTIDRQRDDITTSEGQSYAMLRAVWVDDKETFDRSWKWTKDNIWKQNKLFAWKFGEKADGSYGILEDKGGLNSAVDADTDIAMALLFAYARWQEPTYLLEADSIIKAIWNETVVYVNGKPYITSNDIEQFNENEVVLNPSYYAPYAYRMFAVIDPAHDWNGVIDTSYEIVRQSFTLPLDKDTSVGVPPDWIIMDRRTGGLKAPEPSSTITTNYSYDAHRVMWRLALDHKWYNEQRAVDIFKDNPFLLSEWQNNGLIANSYSRDGEIIYNESSPATVGANIGYFMLVDENIAKQIYNQELLPLYNRDNQNWTRELSYYDSNWAWFGIALYNDLLPNYFSTLTAGDIKRGYE